MAFFDNFAKKVVKVSYIKFFYIVVLQIIDY